MPKGVRVRIPPRASMKETKPKWWKQYLANKGKEAHQTRCMPADQLRALVEACEGWLADHMSIMDPEEVVKLDRSIRSAQYSLSRPLGWFAKKMSK